MLTKVAHKPGRLTIDMLDQRRGFLVVTQFAGYDQHGGAMWRCTCDCGNEHVCLGAKLRCGATTSCGCLRAESARAKGRARKLAPGEYMLRQRFQQYATSAKQRGHLFGIERDQFDHLVLGKCHYCGSAPPAGSARASMNGIDRVDNAVGYVPGNVVTACYTCNRAKANASPSEFAEWVKRVYETLCSRKAEAD